MKKYYTLTGIIDSVPYSTRKKFQTREKAFNHMCKQLNIFQSLQDEYEKEKHVIEYKFSETTRFIISRQFA